MSSNKKMKVYKAKDGWRWQLWGSSDIVADSGGAYENRGEAVRMAQQFIDGGHKLADRPSFVVEDCEEDA